MIENSMSSLERFRILNSHTINFYTNEKILLNCLNLELLSISAYSQTTGFIFSPKQPHPFIGVKLFSLANDLSLNLRVGTDQSL